mmetsp:Transcript_74086/g.221107  ORF Transcript_74086/g.221107 Transcript_74086/m.221107 type:complete len:214 (+) Transcript_74086:113-754(+)
MRHAASTAFAQPQCPVSRRSFRGQRRYRTRQGNKAKGAGAVAGTLFGRQCGLGAEAAVATAASAVSAGGGGGAAFRAPEAVSLQAGCSLGGKRQPSARCHLPVPGRAARHGSVAAVDPLPHVCGLCAARRAGDGPDLRARVLGAVPALEGNSPLWPHADVRHDGASLGRSAGQRGGRLLAEARRGESQQDPGRRDAGQLCGDPFARVWRRVRL